ncbi:MAG: RHS repeat-associated core domain-containing protein [Rhodocyclaceae bacterium]|nr:MAG: RHS repeat-associated core domain-containing protein [Rhodocyclaceae bacterium]TND02006.1 MAG: RHS repeat-associated core domain-containing protein [Rhodocyclaceae bacterium]
MYRCSVSLSQFGVHRLCAGTNIQAFATGYACPSTYTCPLNSAGPDTNHLCTCNTGYLSDSAGTQCVPKPCLPDEFGSSCAVNAAAKQAGPLSCPQPATSNPIALGTGNKYLPETDYAGSGISALTLGRTYNSAPSNRAKYDLAAQWSLGINRGITLDNATNPTIVVAARPDGKALRFTLSGGVWIADADITDRLTQLTSGATVTGWRYAVASDSSVEDYDASGLLLRITDRNSLIQQFSSSDGTGGIQYASIPHVNGYQAPACVRPAGFSVPTTAGVLLCVSDGQGRQLNFSYDGSGRLDRFADPLGQITQYAFDADNNLASVTHPDGTIRSYHYENTTYKNALTGITDENGVRYATYGYDSQGRATSETLAGGADAATLNFGTNGATATTTVTDALGAARTYSFQTILGVARSTGSTQPAGSGCGPSASSQSYDANGNIASRTDFNGNTTTYGYDLARNLETTRTEASGTALARTISTQWHPYWRLPIKVAEPKKLTTYVYNGDGGVLCAPAGALIGSQPIGVVCSRTEQATTDATGSQGLSPTVTGSPRTWSWTYNEYGQVLSANGPRTDVTDVTTYTYHPANDASPGRRGNLATLTNALGHVTQITAYDGNGRPLTLIDPNNVTLAFTHTPRGWLATSSVAGGSGNLVTTYAHDGVGQLTSLTRPDGSTISYDHDPAHRLTAIADGAGNRVEFTLDALGNITRTDWLNPDSSTARSHRATFDALGRLQAAIDTRNAVDYSTTHGHDAKGNPTTVTDPKSQTTTTQYDALDRPTRITDALLGLTTLAYDARGQITQFQAPNNAQTSFTVDGLGNVTTEASADRGSLTATHDAAGNLLTLADARGIVESHTYDALNRPLTVTYPTTGENFAYTWDSFAGCANGVGRLCRVADNGGATTFSYDARGNLVSEVWAPIGGGSHTTQFAFDGADRVNTVISPTGKVLTVQRDTDGRIQQLSTAVGTNPQINLVANVQTDAAGNTKAQTFGNNVTEARSYAEDGLAVNAAVTEPTGGGGETSDNGDVPTLPEWGMILLGALLLGIGYRKQGGGTGWPGRLASALLILLVLPLLATSPAALANETLTYDANGNVQTRTLSGGTTTYGYDALDRVVSEAGPAKTQSLTYDPNDNRLTDGSGAKTYTANTDRIVAENGQNFTLDATGNVTQARGLNFVWNQRAAQIRTVSQGATLLASYTYDYKGRRRSKTTTATTPQGAQTILYHYDLNDRLLAETTGSGSPLFTYVWRDDVPVSIIVHGATETALYLETDHLNTPIAARDQAGKVVWKWESDAFGTTLPNEDPDGDTQKTTINLRFPGQYFDRESGLHYNWNRYYDPKLGRYMSPDPIGLAGGANPMTYVRGNPVNTADRSGLCPFCPLLYYGAIYSSQLTAAAIIAAEIIGNVPNPVSSLVGGAARAAKAAGQCAAKSGVAEGTKVFRVWGDEAGAWGRSWSTVDPRTISDYRNAAGLPNQNTGRFLSEGILENTTGIKLKSADPLHGNVGGLPEIVIPNPAQQIRMQNVQGLNPQF